MASQGSLPTVSAADNAQHKRIHSLVVDTGPLIKNEPALSTLLSQSEQIYTIPSVLAEIKASCPFFWFWFSTLGDTSVTDC